jgi:hypothetical protein
MGWRRALVVRATFGVGVLALAACGSGGPGPEVSPPPAAIATVAEPSPAEPPPAEPPPATEEPPAEPEPQPAEPLPGLPAPTAGYRDWLLLNEEPIPPNPDGDAHLGTKNVYASLEAGRSNGRIVYPEGTIIVKEAKRPDTSFIGLIAVMRKEQGADPEHGDWIFVEYTRSSPTEAFQETAAGAVCWGCHEGARDTDWVWVRTLGSAP